ncbi:MAG: hypothetical protein EA350_11625 [Gemmatimonadales bacterium]|nr:MAG: hypothetical protein EA350_11625 [Gemmatimonadales bacterium]
MNPSVVHPASYLGQRTVPGEHYAPEAPPRLLPVLDLRLEPMDRLMLVGFADDPVYAAVELQVFSGDAGEESARVLLERADTVDVYDSPGRVADEADRRTLEALFAPKAVTLQEASFEFRLGVSHHGLETALRMRDREGREIDLEVRETRGEPRFGALIAPVGAASDRPGFLPVFFLDDFSFVRRRGAEIRIEIDGQERSPQTLTRLVRGPASYFTRYSTRVVLAHWNERREATLEPVVLEPGTEVVEAGGIEWHLAWNAGHPEARSAVARSGDDAVTFLFSPALPDLEALRPGVRVDGRFVVNVNDVPGVVAGEYSVVRNDEDVRLVFQPLRGWQPPMAGPPWVSSYRYEAVIDLQGDRARLESSWTRRDGG